MPEIAPQEATEEPCAYVVYPGSRYGPTPEPPEFCEEPAVPGEDYCERHLA